jgi:cytoskeletal protein CcmA (bactofilin family)
VSFLRGNNPGQQPGDDSSASLSQRPGVVETQRPTPVEASSLPRYEAVREPLTSSEAAPGRGPTPPERCTNVIAAGSKWKGSLSVQESVRIDGQLSGDIEAVGTIHIADGAVVDAKIKAAFVVISGTFKGEVRSLERLELLPKSKVQGELITKSLNIHEGATLDGSIRMSSDKEEGPRIPAETEPRGNGLQPAASRTGRTPETRPAGDA